MRAFLDALVTITGMMVIVLFGTLALLATSAWLSDKVRTGINELPPKANISSGTYLVAALILWSLAFGAAVVVRASIPQ